MELSFGGFQIIVLIAFLVVTVSLVAIFALVAVQARRNVEFELVTDTGYRLRRYWLAFLALLLTTGVVFSLFFLPYPGADETNATVRVSGGLFYWSMNPETVPAGSKINFDVTSADVNHGFGIYDPDGVLIGSVQAMPGYHNQLDLSLDKAGTYMIACLEFCGFKHHEMTREFEVTP
ncbi:MAG: cytochrome c oxidase subunit II [Solirubrobacterales bacterium]|nr:cytochrome c oxidase subunit II [Solirubrobacterales bacterium]